jgi:hypothetical protein
MIAMIVPMIAAPSPRIRPARSGRLPAAARRCLRLACACALLWAGGASAQPAVAPAAGDTVGGLRLIRAADLCGRDISGNTQAL